MVLAPIVDLEDIDFTPSMPLIDFSRGSVICDSIIPEFAPEYDVCTVMIGGSIAGYNLTPRKLNPTTPINIIIRLKTTDATGLFKAISEIIIIVYLLIDE